MGAAVFANASPSHAQPSRQEVAAARALFQEGRRLAERGQWEAALDRFQRSNALRPAGATKYNVALALGQLGRLVEGTELCREIMQEAARGGTAVRASCEELVRNLEPRLGQLTVRLDPRLAGAQVSLDGRALAASMLGVSVPVDPGPHRLLTQRGALQVSREAHVAEGQRLEIVMGEGSLVAVAPAARSPRPEANPTVPVPEAALPPASPVSPGGPPSASDRPEPGRRSLVLPLLLGGAGVLALGSGIVAGILALGVESSLAASCPNHECDPTLAGQLEYGRTLGLLADIFIPAGVAALGAGVAVWLLSKRGTEQPRVTFVVSPTGVSGGVRWSF